MTEKTMQNIQNAKPGEVIPVSEQELKELGQVEKIEERGYFMSYRHGMSPFNFKGFRHRGDLKSARDRAFKHGQIMGYKNIWVFPQFVDLDKEESDKLYSGEVKFNHPPEPKTTA